MPANNPSLFGKFKNPQFSKIYSHYLNYEFHSLENTESVASKLMKKMGWNEGTGLGKNLQGISAPIEVFFYKPFLQL